MPQVPTPFVPSVGIQPVPTPYQRFDTNADMFGAAQGRALQGVGDNLQQLSAILQARAEKQRAERASAEANQAFVAASVDMGQLDANYFSLEGKNAPDAYPQHVKDIEALRAKYLKALPSDEAKKLFDNDFTRSAVYSINSASKHAATQEKTYTSDQSMARVQTAINDSAGKFNDEGVFKGNLDVIKREMAGRGASEGWAPEKLSYETKVAEGKAYAARIREMAIYSPFEASTLLEQEREKLAPDDAIILENSIKESRRLLGSRMVTDQVMSGGPTASPDFVGAVGGDKFQQAQFFGSRGHGLDTNVDPEFGNRAFAAIQAAEAATGAQAVILDMHRAPERQAQYRANYTQRTVVYNGVAYSPQGGGGGLAAAPGKSKHQFGLAMDIAPGPVLDWLHVHASEYGLEFLKGSNFANDPGHMQIAGGGAPSARGMGDFAYRVFGAETSFGRNIQTSSAGAEGPMQVMPDTARMVSAQLGIPFSMSRLRGDYQYNMLIGTTYLNMMLQRFGGNQTLAAAAYNAGPGSVDKWIKQFGNPLHGEISDKEWAAKIPIGETRNYVAKVMGSTAQAPAGAAGRGQTLSVLLDQGREQARLLAPNDPVFQDNVEARITSEYNRQESIVKDQQTAAYNLVGNAALGEGADKPTSIDTLLQDRGLRQAWDSLDFEKRKNVMQVLENNGKADVPVTPQVLGRYHELRGLSITDEEAFKKAEIFADPNLNNAMKKELVELQTKAPSSTTGEISGRAIFAAGAAGPFKRVEQMALSGALEVAKFPLQAAGVWATSASSTSEKRTFNTFVGAFSAQLLEFQKEKKRQPTDDEVLKMTGDLLKKTDRTSGLFGQTEHRLFEEDQATIRRLLGVSSEVADQVVVKQVPPRDKQSIINAYTAKMGVAPSEDQIWQIWKKAHSEKPTLGKADRR